MAKSDNSGGKPKPKHEHDVHVRGTIHTDLSPNEEKRHNAERREDAATHEAERHADIGRDSHKVWLERFTLLAVIIYAGITFWQGRLTRESIDNNAKQFQIDQRPYVWTLGYYPADAVHIKAGDKILLNISWVNYGKAPAIRTEVTGNIFWGVDAMQKADKWFASIGEGPLPVQDKNFFIVPPVIPSDRDKPIGGEFSTARSDDILKAEDVDYILNTDESVAIIARIQYFDHFGTRYWSDMCLTRYKNGALPHCATHNEIH